jgi:predicted short-subunit dehydrogenase-like oxidoreductase (DUF2520 family)
MRELDQAQNGLRHGAIERVAIVGPGRLGRVLATGLSRAGVIVDGPLGRDVSPATLPGRADAVLLCVPDAAIASVAARIAPGAPVGHCSGATGLGALGGHEAFSLHPLMTVPAGASPELLQGAGAAVAGATPRARSLAVALASLLGLRPVEIADEDRVAYHTAASIAANFLVTLEAAAEQIGASAGLPRELLVPLVRAAVDNWAALGSERALTGPVARGDVATVARQRAALAQRAPELLELFDALADATERLATTSRPKAVAA